MEVEAHKHTRQQQPGWGADKRRQVHTWSGVASVMKAVARVWVCLTRPTRTLQAGVVWRPWLVHKCHLPVIKWPGQAGMGGKRAGGLDGWRAGGFRAGRWAGYRDRNRRGMECNIAEDPKTT